jgi:hypothetical protein
LYRVIRQAAIRIFGHDLLNFHERLLDDWQADKPGSK